MPNVIEVTIAGTDALSPVLRKADGALGQFGEAATKTGEELGAAATRGESFGLSLTDLKSGISLVTGTFTSFIQTAKAAFEFSQEGAQIQQLGESFSRLGVDLRAIEAAARNTVNHNLAAAAASGASLSGCCQRPYA
jgi:hypothetical protein